MKKKKAFTLAEVLITLGIIGVVAAMTLPTLGQKLNNRANVVAMKKVYTMLSQVTVSVAAENPIDSWNMKTANLEATEDVFEKYKPYFKIVKDCGCGNRAVGCWSTSPTKALDGQTYYYGHSNGIGATYCAVRLADGMNISFDTWLASSLGAKYPNEVDTDVYFFYVDVNGDKSPNTLGYDVFQFVVKKGKHGVIPAGIANNSAKCTKLDKTSFAGVDCAARVLHENRISY